MKVTLKTLNSSGFVSTRDSATILGHSPDYNLRGYGKLHSGSKEIDGPQFDALIAAFSATSNAAAERAANDYGRHGYAPGGEGPAHLALKNLVASDPAQLLREPGLTHWKTEFLMPTGDRVDIVLKDRNGRFVAVEIEVDCGAEEVIGPLQYMKYRALIAYAFELRPEDVRCILVLRSVHSDVRKKCLEYGIEVIKVPSRRQR